ncbi:hemerythrin HHE cation binding domain family protein, putative [Francisella tularensis subsp. novicida FTE]|nr:hemerythrin HHE cation binding domain family protein, putative [Francisella tularensis subsp. novicida FTE]
MIIILIFTVLLTSIIAIPLILKFKKNGRLLPNFRQPKSIKLKRSLKQLLSQTDRNTRKSFKTVANFFIHVNTSGINIVEKETIKTLGIELYKIETSTYNQYLSDQSYILELHKLNNDHKYKELGKFCNKISSLIGKVPIIVYSFEYKNIKNDTVILEEIKSLRSIILQLSKIYKKLPNVVLSIADIENYPGYNSFIECASLHNVPLLSPAFNPNNLNTEIDTYIERLNILANNLLFKKYPLEFLNFTYFINCTYNHFKYLLKKQNYIDTNKTIENIYLYLSNTKVNIGQSLFQNNFTTQPYKTKLIKKFLTTIIGVILTTLGLIFTMNIFTYKSFINQYKQELSAIPNTTKYSKETINLSNDYESDIKSRLLANILYPNEIIKHGIYINEGLKIQQQILEKLENTNSENNYIYKTFIFLTLIAPQNINLQKYIKANIHLWSIATKLSEKTIITYIEAPVPKLKINIENACIQKLSLDNQVIDPSTYSIVKSYIIDNSNINLKTLHDFLYNIDLPTTKQEVISGFMIEVFPKIKNSLSECNRKFLEKLYEKIKNSNSSLGEITKIKKLVPTEKETQVDNLQAAISILVNLNNKLSKNLSNSSETDLIWYKVILQATYNDIMNNLSLSEPQLIDNNTTKLATINIGDNGEYYGNISVIYTKTGLKDVILPEIYSYKSLSKLLATHNIDTLAIDNYYNESLQNYIENYKKSYINLITSYKNSIDPNDIVSSLLLISSTSSQFNNMLKTLVDNTVFDDETLKELPQLSLVGSYFENINKMIINPNDMDKYHQIIREIADNINQNGNKRESLNKITLNLFTRSKDSYFYKINTLLKDNNITGENSIIFIAPLESIMKFGKPYLSEYKYNIWNKDIISLLKKYQTYFPFSKESNKTISPKELTDIFGPNGEFWKNVRKNMYGIFEYQNGIWQSKIPDFFGNNTKYMLDTLNKVQKMTNTLWDSSGKPKPIDITLGVMPAPNGILPNNTFVKMTILSIGNQKAIGISTQQKPIILEYKWFEKQPSSVGYIDSNEQINTIETQSSYWSFINLLNQAKNSGDVYIWNQNDIEIKFKIDFNNIFMSLETK